MDLEPEEQELLDANPPDLGINISEGVGTDERLR